MLSCDQAREAMQADLDRAVAPSREALAPSRDVRLQPHLSSCAACRADAARFTALVAALEALPPAEVPAGFADAVMADLPEMLPASEGPAHVLRWGVAIAALLSGFIAALALLVNEGGPAAARQALRPLGASLQLGGIMLAQAAAALAIGLTAMSDVLAKTSVGAKIAAVVAFAALNAALLAMLTRLRPEAREARARRRR